MTTAPTEELDKLAQESCQLLGAMAIGAIKQGQMPPRRVFDWLVEYNTETLVAMEREIMAVGGEPDPDVGAALEQTVVALSTLLGVCDANQLLVTKDAAVQRLNARRLRLPPDFDHTYEGMLPRG